MNTRLHRTTLRNPTPKPSDAAFSYRARTVTADDAVVEATLHQGAQAGFYLVETVLVGNKVMLIMERDEDTLA